MQRLALRHTTRRPFRQVTRTLSVCVVDPQEDDYQGWDELAEAKGAKLQIVGNVEEVLRLARTAAVDLWVINTELPGLSGFDLCRMLRDRQSKAAMCLVADEYSPDTERNALRAGATMFTVKAAHPSWFSALTSHVLHRATSGVYHPNLMPN